MKRFKSTIGKVIMTVCVVVGVATAFSVDVKADEIADLQAAQAAQAAANQQILLQQQALLNAQYQQILLQQQALFNAQYQAALRVANQGAVVQQDAFNQSLLLSQVQNQQYQQYKSMIQTMGLEYQPYLLDEYSKYQQKAITGFNGYNGVVY